MHRLATLLADLGTICLNTIAPADPALPGFRLVTTPTALQRQAFDLLGVSHRLGAGQTMAHGLRGGCNGRIILRYPQRGVVI